MSFFSTLHFLNYEILIVFVCRFESATPPSILHKLQPSNETIQGNHIECVNL